MPCSASHLHACPALPPPQIVAHSLGGATVLMYAVGRRMMGQPHRARRIVLMSPAGFHTHVPFVSVVMVCWWCWDGQICSWSILLAQ